MKIVIDIDEDMYKSVVNNDAYVLGDVDWILLENAIANGTPLPEHHGKIITEKDGGIGYDYVRPIKYCPMCGRKLKEEEE